jgi:O-antigen ligase/polysaccharide polymerase Wzy-like membrane protein
VSTASERRGSGTLPRETSSAAELALARSDSPRSKDVRIGAAPTAPSLTRWIQRAVLALLLIMPFHALLSVWLGHLVGHQAIWQSWKEVVLIAATAGTGLLLYREPKRWQRLQTPAVYAGAGFIVVALIVTALSHPSLTAAIYGLKTDTEFLLAFAIAAVVADAALVRKATRLLLATSSVVIGFGLLQIYVLPANWLVHLGYGPHTILPYELVDPAVTAIRILSTLGGPNQLGSFLILPLCVAMWRLGVRFRWWQPPYIVAGLIVLWHSYSRSAVLGLAVGIMILVVMRLPRRKQLPALLGFTIVAAIALQVITSSAGRSQSLQYYIFHQTLSSTGFQASTTDHASATSMGLQLALHHPLGLGLGSAGPASFHSSHILIPEDYYLQLAIETGLLGMALFVAAELLLGWQLWHIGNRSAVAPPLVAALVGMGVVNLFLHGWADSSTALVFWSLAGSVAGATI